MAEATERLLLQVDAATELLRQHMNDNERTVSKFDAAAQKTLDRFDGRLKKVGAGGMPGIDRSVDQARSSLSRLDAGIANVRGSLASLAAGAGLAGLAGAAHTFIGLAEASKQMRAQLTLATSDFGTFAQGQADVERIAGNTRIGLAASTALYGTLVRAAQPLGRTQADAAVATETFAKALKIGGASAEAASSATLQFSQALASGVLRGDEFNSIAEASPRILKLLADALGVPQGQLRALAAEGKLTSDKLYDALTNTKVTAGLEAEFRQLPVTTEEAMLQVRDSAIVAFGAFDRGAELSTMLVNFISDGKSGFGDLASSAEQSGARMRSDIGALYDIFEPLFTGADSVFGRIEARANYARDTIAGILSAYDRVRNFGVGLDRGVVRLENLNPFTADQALPEYFDTSGDYLRRNASRRQLSDAQRRDREIRERAPAGAARNAGELTDWMAGTGRFAPRSKTPPASDGKKKPKGRARAKSAAPAAPFVLRDNFETSITDPAERQRDIDAYARRQLDGFKVLFGDKDPLGAEIERYNQDLRENVEAAFTVDDDRESPVKRYREQLEREVGDMGVALEGVKVRGLDALSDGLEDIVTGASSVGDAFKGMATSIIADLARIAIQKAILGAIGGGFLGFADGGSLAGVPGFADGGSPGGQIRGPGTGRSDSVLALLRGPGGKAVRLSNREFIMNEAAVNFYGADAMAAINARQLPRFAGGGSLGSPSLRQPRLPASVTGSAQRERMAVDVRVTTEPSPLFQQQSEATAYRVVGAAAEPIMAGSETRVMKRLGRPGLPGGF